MGYVLVIVSGLEDVSGFNSSFVCRGVYLSFWRVYVYILGDCTWLLVVGLVIIVKKWGSKIYSVFGKGWG